MFKKFNANSYLLPTILISTLFAEEPLELSSIEGSHSVGHDQNMLGINSYNKKNLTKY